jgi:hypothetical protein
MSTTTYDRGRAAGYAEALEREDDGAREQDGPTWFSCPVAEQDGDEYERGWLDGWAEYMAARAPRHPTF